MQVETFECQETAAEPCETSQEAMELIESLGLTGQQNFVAKTKTGLDTRHPYREMTAEEFFVYSVLCPTSCAIEHYKASPIPLRVLQLAAHAKQVIDGCRLVVMDRTDIAIPDPVLIATTGRYEWSVDTRYILARWGDVLTNFSLLKQKALEIRRNELLASAKECLSSVQNASDASILTKPATVSW